MMIDIVAEPSAFSRDSLAHAVPGLDLDALYREHSRSVARWVAHLGGKGHVEDLVHDVFMVVGRKLPAFHGEPAVSAWIFRITQKVLANHRRRERVRRFLGLTPRLEETLAAPGKSAADLIDHQQAVAGLHRVLDRLPYKFRRVLVLFEMDELSSREIATLLGARESTVRVWLHRARDAFREELSRQEGSR